ncbi:uncharacterized protein [Narcine bancroftii]|uniref:uncharacterized protein isoform X2 n=1 Tax=Narcine bancroftii TaxID=1343680 RepID=UPI0038318D1A
MAFRRHSCPTVALLVLGCFAVLANSAPRLKSERLKAAKHDEDTHTRLVGKDLFRGLEESGPCYVLREVIDFYLATVLKPDQWLAQFSHLKEVKEFLAVLTKKHMADCDTEEKTNANKNIEQLKQKVGEFFLLGEASKAKVVRELFILLQEIGSRCSTPRRKPGHGSVTFVARNVKQHQHMIYLLNISVSLFLCFHYSSSSRLHKCSHAFSLPVRLIARPLSAYISCIFIIMTSLLSLEINFISLCVLTFQS